jgi:hypothetical protein
VIAIGPDEGGDALDELLGAEPALADA